MSVRWFVNERGNPIRVSVQRDVPDPDAVCAKCRWRGGHNPACPAGPTWPTCTVVKIEGPNSTSENFLTPMEAGELLRALSE
jgi:hypothetical protein